MAQMTVQVAARPTGFLRNATGLVKAWSAFDAFVYSFMSVNLITLGLYGMSLAYAIPGGHLVPAIIFTGIAVTLLVVVYAALIAAIPRAGGDYTSQSRILGGGDFSALAPTARVVPPWRLTPTADQHTSSR